MYERHFGLKMKPFALTPDPEFLYPSRQHAMAMTMLEYGLESQAAFCLLTGDIGSGKTTLVRRLLRQFADQVAVGLISHTHGSFKSIHGWALSALGIAPTDDSDIAMYEALVDAFVREYARGRRTLLIFDEAQNHSIEVLEELRLLSNVNSEKDLVLADPVGRPAGAARQAVAPRIDAICPARFGGFPSEAARSSRDPRLHSSPAQGGGGRQNHPVLAGRDRVHARANQWRAAPFEPAGRFRAGVCLRGWTQDDRRQSHCPGRAGGDFLTHSGQAFADGMASPSPGRTPVRMTNGGAA